MWRCVTIPLRRCHGACGPDLASVRAQRHAPRQLAGILHANPAADVTRPSRGRTESVWTRRQHRRSVKVRKQPFAKPHDHTMKLPSIFICAFLLVGCARTEPKTALTEKQACLLAMKEFPPSKDMYAAHFAYGIWHITTISTTNSNPTAPIEVATVRDSDGKVEIVKKP